MCNRQVVAWQFACRVAWDRCGPERSIGPGGRIFLQVQVQCICGTKNWQTRFVVRPAGSRRPAESYFSWSKNRDYGVLRLERATVLHALHAPQNYKILSFRIKCTYVLYILPHKTHSVSSKICYFSALRLPKTFWEERVHLMRREMRYLKYIMYLICNEFRLFNVHSYSGDRAV